MMNTLESKINETLNYNKLSSNIHFNSKKMVISNRKPDLTYDLETVLAKLNITVEN